VKIVVFHEEAEKELKDAARFYAARRENLGAELVVEVRHATRILQDHPALGHAVSRRVRRLLVRRFPFAVVYRAETDRIFILAVAHLSRRPGYWRQRG
jgi:plasmid stabilization system protein ParE